MAHMHCENGICRMIEDEEDVQNYLELTDFLITLQKNNNSVMRRIYLLHALEFAQNHYSWIDVAIQKKISDALNIPSEEIFGVIRFYKTKFHGTGYMVKLCCGDHCLAKNAGNLSKRLQNILGSFHSGEEVKRANGIGFIVEFTDCLGACTQAPSININGHVYSTPTENELRHLLHDVIIS